MLSIKKQYLSRKSFVVLLMIFSFYPYVFCNIIQIDIESMLLVGYTTLFLYLYSKRKTKVFKIPKFLHTTIIIQIITWICYFIIHADSSYLSRLLFIVLTFTSLSILLYEGSIVRFAKTYNWVITIMAIAGLPVFFLFALGLLHPIFTFTNLDGREAGFFGITCSNAYTSGICRVAGFFDEPGAFAFWGIYALLINKLFFNNRKVEIGLIIGLLTTLSAAYFVQLCLYILFFYTRNIKYLIVILTVLFACGYFAYRELSDNVQLAYLTVDRFEDGQIKSARYELTKDAERIFVKSPIFGIGAKRLQQVGYLDDNPYEIPAKDGVVGFCITYLPLLILLKRYGRKNLDLLLSILILFAGYMQRPFHINELHFFMLYLFAILAYLKYERGVIKDE